MSLQSDCIRVEASYSAVIPRQGNYCSVVGQVVETGQAVEGLAIDDAVVALAPPAPSITLLADSCQ